MRSLAEFVMKGRRQAVIAVLLLGLVPLVYFLNPAVVGLVMLRKGFREGILVFVWAVLPVGAWAYVGDVWPLLMLLSVTGMSVLLRETESWEFTLLTGILVGVAGEMYLRLQPQVLDLVFLQLEQYLQSNQLQGMQLEDLRELMTGFIGAVYMFLAVMLLMLARWWQAALFNPGGFQEEFHRLRIGPKAAMVLLAVMLLANFGIVVPDTWVLFLVMPLLVAGLAVCHGVVKLKAMSGSWLIALYALLVFPIVMQLLVLLALVDSWYDFRQRIAKPPSPPAE
ncbi:MAG: hypothetical protein RL120_13765 [Gammaproteobacteria bacterium]